MGSLARDLRFAVRSLVKTPGFSIVVLLTLALGIGANTAIFSVVHGVLLKRLDFHQPDRLVTVWEHTPDDAGRMQKSRVTAANYFDWRAQSTVFEEMAVFGSASFSWTGDGEPEQLLGARVSASYFSVLGVEPLLGRFFLPDDDEPGRLRTVVLGHGLWQRRFGASADAIGEILTFDGGPIEVIGVAPPNVYPTWPQATGRMPFLPVYQEIFVPMQLSEERAVDRRSHVYGVLARLKKGVTLEGARAEMDTIARRLERAYPRANAGERVLVRSYVDELVGGARPALLILLGAVGLVLLIACANIAGLHLARSSGKRREVALRAALGASRLSIIGQFLAESLLLAAGGGMVGVGLAVVGVDVLIALSPEAVPRLTESGLELPVLAFALAATLLTGVLFGLAPALAFSKATLTDDTRSTPRRRLAPALVVSEVALAVVLVVAAGLLVQSFWRLQQVDLGFRARDALVAEITLPSSTYASASSIARFHERVLERVKYVPQVEQAAFAYDHPLDSNWIDSFRIIGGSETDESLGAIFRIVGTDYFRTMGIDVVRGREFTELDDPDHPGAVIINEAFARRYFPDTEPLGRSLSTSTPRRWDASLPDTFEIVGVVRNVKFLGPTAGDEPAFYVPSRQFPVPDMVLLVRGEGDPALLAPRLRDEVWAIDPDLPVGNITTLERLRAEALAQPRFSALLLALFGFAALSLAAMGLYGLLAYDVSRRTSEIGIRMALGAQAKDVLGLVVRHGARLTALGLALGVVLAFLTTRVLSGLLFGIAPNDPRTFAAVALFLGGIALLASFFPARRATKVAPVIALREN